jgi:hypothetical protein
MLAASLNYCFDHMSAFGICITYQSTYHSSARAQPQARLRLLPNSAGQAIGALAAGFLMRASGGYCRLSIVTHVFVGSGLLISFAEHTIMESILHFRHSGPWLWVNACNQPHYRHQFRSSRGISTCHVSVVRVSLCGVDSWCYICFSGILTCPKEALWKRIGHVSNANTIIDSVCGNFQEISHVDPPIKQDVLNSYMVALIAVFCTTFGMSCLAGIVNLFMREHKLHSMLSRI